MEARTKQLRSRRCTNHQQREAAARCPVCKKYFCRECVTEDKGKMLCRGCLDARASQKPKSLAGISFLSGSLFLLLFFSSFFISWLFFLWGGRILSSIPHKFHDSKYVSDKLLGS